MTEILLILVGLTGLAAGVLLVINGVGNTVAVLNRRNHEEDMTWGTQVQDSLHSITAVVGDTQEQIRVLQKNTDAMLLASLGLVKGMTALLEKVVPGQALAILNGPDIEDVDESTGVEERPL